MKIPLRATLKAYLLGLSLFLSGNVCAVYEITEKKLQSHVNFLTSEDLDGRQIGSEGEKLATEYIANHFRHLGLEPAGDNGTYFQAFKFTTIVSQGQNTRKKITLSGRNVLARLKVGLNASQSIVVGAHVDHLGRGKLGGSRARHNEMEMIHPGADDNASGVASILEAAAKLAELKAQGKLHGNKDIIFAAWSGEELGVLGSSYFVIRNLKNASNKSLRPGIDAAINLDMVGHLRKKLVLQGVGSSPDWLPLINKINQHHHIALITQRDPYLPTDSTPFYLHGVPTLNFFTGAHDDYHTPRDKPETLNYTGIKSISDFCADLVMALEGSPNVLNYKEVTKSTKGIGRRFKIYLGTIPDYASADVLGVKLSGVVKNSPAEIAGIKQDDVVVELAGKKIRDIYDYTFVLNALHVGKPTKIVVLRGKTTETLMVVSRYRE